MEQLLGVSGVQVATGTEMASTGYETLDSCSVAAGRVQVVLSPAATGARFILSSKWLEGFSLSFDVYLFFSLVLVFVLFLSYFYYFVL